MNLSRIVLLSASLLVLSGTATDAQASTPWDTQITTNRFRVLSAFDGEAVLDRETGLVWERSALGHFRDWYDAARQCRIRKTGGRMGWRLPTVEELTSLIDPESTSGILLPAGHPFEIFNGGFGAPVFWTATTDAEYPERALVVDLGELAWPGVIGRPVKTLSPDGYIDGWCVRGGNGHDGM
jgi:hypothetical protein